MKRVLITIFIFISQLAIAQNPWDYLLREEPNGETILKYKDGTIREKYTKINGHLHGTAFEYYSNGQIKNIALLENGKFIDTAKSYYDNGLLRTLEVYRLDTLLYSEILFYYKNGQLFWIIQHYLDDLNIDISSQKMHYSSILGHSSISFNRFKLAGIPGCNQRERLYYKTGQLWEDIARISGERDGENRTYFKNGQLMFLEMYSNGQKTGKQIRYDKDGNIKKIVCYEEGEKINCH